LRLAVGVAMHPPDLELGDDGLAGPQINRASA
jgi:hypothetical protein